MLHLTREATDHLRRTRRDLGVDRQQPARLLGNGALVGFTFKSEPTRDDRVILADDMQVYVAPELADALDRAVLDARVEDGRSILVLRLQDGARFIAAGDDA